MASNDSYRAEILDDQELELEHTGSIAQRGVDDLVITNRNLSTLAALVGMRLHGRPGCTAQRGAFLLLRRNGCLQLFLLIVQLVNVIAAHQQLT